MTNVGMFEDAEEIEKLKKTIDLLETHATIKDFQIQKLREEIKELQEALEKTEQGTMSVKNYTVKLCDRKEIKNFIETWHYSKNINGLKSNYCFKLLDNNNIIGAMMYGQIAMANVWKKYVANEIELIELRRLCCIDDTPKNTESYFIGFTLRWLKKIQILKLLLVMLMKLIIIKVLFIKLVILDIQV